MSGDTDYRSELIAKGVVFQEQARRFYTGQQTPFAEGCDHKLEILPVVDFRLDFRCQDCHGLRSLDVGPDIAGRSIAAIGTELAAELGGTFAHKTYVDLLARTREAGVGDGLKVLVHLADLALNNGEITEAQRDELWKEWTVRFGQLGLEARARLDSKYGPEDPPPSDEPIVLTSLTRLDVQPGETLAVVAPIPNAAAVRHLQDMLTAWMSECHPGVHVLVFPEGTELSVLAAPEPSPFGPATRLVARGLEYPVGG